ncbi:hypothetical protein C8R42DRAFT_714456 [Lentinula raphanica]|nr:hypothetical protein C8R42DRAFT_714456 [Lentinula raphanica]
MKSSAHPFGDPTSKLVVYRVKLDWQDLFIEDVIALHTARFPGWAIRRTPLRCKMMSPDEQELLSTLAQNVYFDIALDVILINTGCGRDVANPSQVYLCEISPGGLVDQVQLSTNRTMAWQSMPVWAITISVLCVTELLFGGHGFYSSIIISVGLLWAA